VGLVGVVEYRPRSKKNRVIALFSLSRRGNSVAQLPSNVPYSVAWVATSSLSFRNSTVVRQLKLIG